MTLWSVEKTYLRQKPSSSWCASCATCGFGGGDSCLADSCGCSPDRYFAAGMANLKFWVFVSLAPTVTEAVCIPSLSCQAVIS